MIATDISASKPSFSADDRAAGRAVGEPAAIVAASDRHAVASPESVPPSKPMSWRFELFLAFCNTWVAAQLWFWPGQFPVGATPMALSTGIRGHERHWAVVCVIAALLILAGLVCRLWTPRINRSTALRITGLFTSIVVWTIVGVSLSFDFPHSLAPIILIGGALGASWQLAQWKPPPGPPA